MVIEDLPSTSPVADGVTRLQFPASAGLAVARDLRDGLTVERLAVTSDASFSRGSGPREVTWMRLRVHPFQPARSNPRVMRLSSRALGAYGV